MAQRRKAVSAAGGRGVRKAGTGRTQRAQCERGRYPGLSGSGDSGGLGETDAV